MTCLFFGIEGHVRGLLRSLHDDLARGRFWSIPSVDYSNNFRTQLDLLTNTWADPGTDLTAVLSVLGDAVREAIPSMLGLTVTITEAGDTVTFTCAEPDVRSVGASLHLLLDAMTADAGGAVTLYAAQPGAFVDLAADIRYAYQLNGQVVIDGHLDDVLPAGHSQISGLTEFTCINQAIGVLIGQGQHHRPGRAATPRRPGRRHQGRRRPPTPQGPGGAAGTTTRAV